MQFRLPQIYFSKIMRAIVEFDLIQNNDTILIGLSGGKDSLLLTYALAMMRARLKKRFTLRAFTVNPMFSKYFDSAPLHAFCESLHIPFATEDVDINSIIEENPQKSACYTCAYFRRAVINRHAIANGCNKIAYAHHNDDAVETFLMSILYSGQVQTFAPKTYLDRTDLTVIRPLIYLREEEVRAVIYQLGITPIPSACPHDGNTVRQDVKTLLASLCEKNPQFYAHLAAAMRENNVGMLWPACLNRKQMEQTYYSYIHEKP